MSLCILVAIRPIIDQQPAQLVLQHNDERIAVDLSHNQPITLIADRTTRYCTGWYDIETHTGYICPHAATVEPKHEQCYACRKRTGFNPAFYNTTDISDKQASYNNAPHLVYIAYFGNGLVKAGISAESRGLRRLREQGALLYTIIGTFPTAAIAHYHENELIAAGLRNSILKRQKASQLTAILDRQTHITAFRTLLDDLGYAHQSIIDQVDDYFYGTYPHASIDQLSDNQPFSGRIAGIVGRYLVLNNSNHLYGGWLDDIVGYPITISDTLIPIERPPEQTSLF